MNRGNRSQDIFQNPYDREKFLEYLATTAERFSIKVHTYCLMTNHYHLLVETAQANLSAAIKWLNGSYATYTNAKRQQCGHLFQGRFKSILVEADEYLKHLSRYIHLNRYKMDEPFYVSVQTDDISGYRIPPARPMAMAHSLHSLLN